MNDADKQYRAMHPGQAQQFHADDNQTYLTAVLQAQLQLLEELKNLKVSHNDPASVVVAYVAFIKWREEELKAALKLRSDKA